MSRANYILFIDAIPVNEDLKKYFASFNITIVQQQQLHLIPPESGIPMAILIHWSILKKEFAIIQQFYIKYPVPLLVINDKPDEEACVKVLETGADDFIIEPLHPRELHAKISAINRRVLRTQQNTEQGKEVFVFTNLKLYPASRQVFNENHQELLLSAGEYDLLHTFVQQPQRILNREHLLHSTKNSDLNPFDRRIDVQISRLRQKIEPHAKHPQLIKTIRNGGYMFTAQVVILKEDEQN